MHKRYQGIRHLRLPFVFMESNDTEKFINGQEQAGFINGQGRAEFAKIPYGRSTIGRSGCEAIACYNAMLLLGRPVPFEKVKAYFEWLFRRGLGWLGMGFLGASPLEIRLFLRKNRVRFCTVRSVRHFRRILAGQAAEDPEGEVRSGVLIVSYWNKPLLKYGYHTVAVDVSTADITEDPASGGTKAPAAGMVVYNRYNNSAGPERISDISELMQDNWRFIRGFYLYN